MFPAKHDLIGWRRARPYPACKDLLWCQPSSSILTILFQMDSLSAVIEALCNASDDDIQRCLIAIQQDKLNRAIERLKPTPPTPDATPGSRLALALQNILPTLQTLFSRGVQDAVGVPRWETEDYHILDIRAVRNYARRKTPQAYFRAYLAEWHFGECFNDYNPSQLADMLQNKTFSKYGKRKMSYTAFLKGKEYTAESIEVARKAIPNGLKYLGIEQFHPSLAALPTTFLSPEINTKARNTTFRLYRPLMLDQLLCRIHEHLYAPGLSRRTFKTSEGHRWSTLDQQGQCDVTAPANRPGNFTTFRDTCFRDTASLLTGKEPANFTAFGDTAFGDTASLLSGKEPANFTAFGDTAFGDTASLLSGKKPANFTAFGETASLTVFGQNQPPWFSKDMPGAFLLSNG
ncbi:uncharacterized protein BDZ99DRAFT_498138 [Mytilinidion resinicola]|uniref:Uncharacterized protein n=1 Tax=Mytilinidion resinicola TaxID=574789 RepID=A0A6A6YM84_9PEZI|nr:uncharacterized protein BDZ99DRAFT_498138 [Mytilinidion resinicola]KAF2809891.1 hypothetical protein BDZ99DRAFT_498138 [Mytilinidion resinicola]